MPKITAKDALGYPNQLKKYRKRVHFKLHEVAKLIGISNSGHLCEYEKSKKLPNLVNALYLSAALGTPVEVLYSELFNAIRKQVAEQKQKHNIYPRYG